MVRERNPEGLPGEVVFVSWFPQALKPVRRH